MGTIASTSIFVVLFSCCINVVILEKLVISLPGIANLITFFQFLFIAIEGFLITTKCGTRRLSIPIMDCLNLIILYFISSVSNNFAYNFKVPTTLHIIIKSGSLVTNMAMGVLIRGRQYSLEKYVSVALITTGIITCTIASASTVSEETGNYMDYFWWCCGIALLIFALVVGAVLGMLQESIYMRCGKHPNDVLFYTHILPLPLFFFLTNDLIRASNLCNQSSQFDIPYLGHLPIGWILLLVNVLTQYLCVRSVYILTSECSSLTVTLVLTLRKFTSLLISVIMFQNIFNLAHWMGTLLVFLGTCQYLDFIKLVNFQLINNTKHIKGS